MAKLITRKRGASWEYRFEVASVGGKRKELSKSGFRTKAQAQAAGTKAMNEYNTTGEVIKRSDISFADYLEDWKKEYCATLKETSQKGYEKTLRLYIIPELGHYRLSALTPAILESFLFLLYNRGFSDNTITNVSGVLSGALNYAVKSKKLLAVNPATGLNSKFSATPTVATRKKPHDFIPTDEQWNMIIKRFHFGTSCHIPLIQAYRCGERLGEIFGTMWSDIDFENGTINIQRQMQHGKNGIVFLAPKYNSYRTIRLDEHVLKVLKEQKEKQDCSRDKYAAYLPHYYLPVSKDNGNTHLHGQLLMQPQEGCEEVFFCTRSRRWHFNSRPLHTVLQFGDSSRTGLS